MSAAMNICESSTFDHYDRLKQMLEEAERRAINRHKYDMSMQQGEDVGFEVAARDWFEHCAEAWHEHRLRKMLQMQREEINRYKWIESERACKDLGRSAVEDWIHKHAAEWRVMWEETHLDKDPLDE